LFKKQYYNLSRNRNKLKVGDVMNRTKASLNTFVGLNRTIDHLEQIVRNDIQRYGLNVTEFAVLELLYNKGDQPIQRIGDRVLIASSSITYVVDKLETKGYVIRIRNVQDKRVTNASLTEAGCTLMNEIFPKHAATLESTFSILSDEELTTLQHVLKKLSAQPMI
jgi:MarR family 2-MHQ and catechol resistance regulon transcriptional repressor